ncbi:aldehyde dehydrogenase, partial [Rhizobium grahamii]
MLLRLADLVLQQGETFAVRIAREGGKPYTDALVETHRAIDGIQ